MRLARRRFAGGQRWKERVNWGEYNREQETQTGTDRRRRSERRFSSAIPHNFVDMVCRALYIAGGVLMRLLGYGEEDSAQAIAQMEQVGIELPSFVMDMLGANGISPSMIFAMLASGVVLYAIFGTLGGLPSIAIFHKKDAA